MLASETDFLLIYMSENDHKNTLSFDFSITNCFVSKQICKHEIYELNNEKWLYWFWAHEFDWAHMAGWEWRQW